jgi:formylglycine-generating enzyme required for sulfatase activity
VRPANYFVEAIDGPLRVFYPVPLAPIGRGPDGDGGFTVALRRMRSITPPVLEGEPGRFVLVPAGDFAMGDRSTPRQAHFVWVGAFFVDPYEVTNGAFRTFLRAPDGYHDQANWTRAGWSWKVSSRSQATSLLEAGDDKYARFGRDDQPVVLVTWFEANAYCTWLTRRLGWLVRLPTEAEWEKAARGPDSLDYALTNTLSEREAGLYNWRKNPTAAVTVVGVQQTRDVYRPNRYGLYHASGNAAEWTQSEQRFYNRESPYVDDDRNAADAAGTRVARGGSWYSATVSRLSLAYREDFPPHHSSDDLGFRVVVLPVPLRPGAR